MEKDPLQSIDPRNIGEALRKARRAQGLTQEQVADELGYARTTVVAIEKGERRVTEQELIAFAEKYGRPVSEFVRRKSNATPLAPQFRSALPATRSAQALDEAELLAAVDEFESLVLDYVELEEICRLPLPKEYPPEYRLDDSHDEPGEFGEHVAVAERMRLGLGDGPILDLRAILEEAVGLRVFFFPMPPLIAGMFACNDVVGGCIAINSRHPVPRGNFSLAHEFAHFLGTRYQPDVALESGRWMRASAEKFADGFAATFMMPRNGVIRRFSELRDARRGEENICLADLIHLAHFFGVSVQAMCLRLEELRRLPAGTWERLKSRGLKVDAARAVLGLQTPSRNRQMLPQRYRVLAKRAFEGGLISQGQLARKLRTDRVTARSMLEELGDLVDDKTGSGYVPLELDFATRLTEV